MEESVLRVLNDDGTERKRKTVEYNGMTYLVQRDRKKRQKLLFENGEYVLDENGKRTVVNYFPKYIEVNGDKLYLDKNGNVSNKQPGRFSTVDFLTLEEIQMMKNALQMKIDEAGSGMNMVIAWRNYTLFGCGINVGLRASDLRRLKWSDIMTSNGERKVGWVFEAQKTGKRTVITYNDAFFEYLENYRKVVRKVIGEPSQRDYIFFSRKNQNESLCEKAMWNIMNETSIIAGIDKQIGSHSLRKTFGRQIYDAAKDKTAVLVQLQRWFKHSSTNVTLTYIGITQEEDMEMVQSIHL